MSKKYFKWKKKDRNSKKIKIKIKKDKKEEVSKIRDERILIVMRMKKSKKKLIKFIKKINVFCFLRLLNGISTLYGLFDAKMVIWSLW